MLLNKRGEVINKNISKTVHKIKEPIIVLPFNINEYNTADWPFGAYCPQKIIPAIK